MDAEQLESWATRAAKALQEFVDDAQAADPENDNTLPEVRALVLEYERLEAGLPPWQAQIYGEDAPDDEDALCI